MIVAADIAVEALIAPFAILTVLAIPGALAAWLAKRRGRSAVIWGGVGMVLPAIGIALVIVAGETDGSRPRAESA